MKKTAGYLLLFTLISIIFILFIITYGICGACIIFFGGLILAGLAWLAIALIEDYY